MENMLVADEATDQVRAQIVQAVYAKGTPASAIVPLSLQTPLAFICLLLAAVLGGLFVSSTGKQAFVTAIFAASALSFGSIFLIDAVRVYTG